MRRISLYIAIALLAFIVSVAVTGTFYRLSLKLGVEAPGGPPYPRPSPQFIPVSSLIEPDYHIYWYRTPGGSDTEEIDLYGDFRSAKVTRDHFESNARPDSAKLIELGDKVDESGRRVGGRGVTLFHSGGARIFWTDGDTFWSVQAPSLELALEFERSEIVRSITMSNRSLKPTAR